MAPVTPIGWHEKVFVDGVSPERTPYYQNVLTGEATWEPPQRAFLRGVAEAAAQYVFEHTGIRSSGARSGRMGSGNMGKGSTGSMESPKMADSE